MNENPYAWLYEKPCRICGCGLEGFPGMKDGNTTWRHSDLKFCVMALAKEMRSTAYFKGVADALDAIREYEFPHTECVDFVADKLAPSEAGS